MKLPLVLISCLGLVLLMVPVSYCEEKDEKTDGTEEKPLETKDNDEDNLGDVIKEKFKGFGSWLKDAGEEVKEKADFGLGAVKGWAGEVSSRFNKAKDRVENAGTQVKETLSGAASTVTKEVDKAGSKVSEEADKAFESMKDFFS